MSGDGLHIADAAISKDDQVTAAMHIPRFDEPGLPRPLMWCRRFIVKRHWHVVDTRVFRFRIIGAVHEVLHRGTDPTLSWNAEWFERGDPGIRKISGGSAGITARNLRPLVVLLHKQIRPDIQAMKISCALRALCSRPQSRYDRHHQRGQNHDDNDDDEKFENCKRSR